MIDLADLSGGFPGVTEALGEAMAQAAAVCLERQGHAPTVSLLVRYDDDDGTVLLSRCHVTDQMRRAWNDLQEATEAGACAVAVLVVKEVTGLVVVERSRKGTGFDYYLGRVGGTLFQHVSALEVSGILRGDQGDISRRLLSKQEQVRRSAAGMPPYVAIVEFGNPTVWVNEA